MTAPRLGWTAFALFLASVPFANWLIGHVGTTCVPGGPCLVPVAPGLLVTRESSESRAKAISPLRSA